MWCSLSESLGQFGSFSGFYLSLTDVGTDFFKKKNPSCLSAQESTSECLPVATGENPILQQNVCEWRFLVCVSPVQCSANISTNGLERSGMSRYQTMNELTGS